MARDRVLHRSWTRRTAGSPERTTGENGAAVLAHPEIFIFQRPHHRASDSVCRRAVVRGDRPNNSAIAY